MAVVIIIIPSEPGIGIRELSPEYSMTPGGDPEGATRNFEKTAGVINALNKKGWYCMQTPAEGLQCMLYALAGAMVNADGFGVCPKSNRARIALRFNELYEMINSKDFRTFFRGEFAAKGVTDTLEDVDINATDFYSDSHLILLLQFYQRMRPLAVYRVALIEMNRGDVAIPELTAAQWWHNEDLSEDTPTMFLVNSKQVHWEFFAELVNNNEVVGSNLPIDDPILLGSMKPAPHKQRQLIDVLTQHQFCTDPTCKDTQRAAEWRVQQFGTDPKGVITTSSDSNSNNSERNDNKDEASKKKDEKDNASQSKDKKDDPPPTYPPPTNPPPANPPTNQPGAIMPQGVAVDDSATKDEVDPWSLTKEEFYTKIYREKYQIRNIDDLKFQHKLVLDVETQEVATRESKLALTAPTREEAFNRTLVVKALVANKIHTPFCNEEASARVTLPDGTEIYGSGKGATRYYQVGVSYVTLYHAQSFASRCDSTMPTISLDASFTKSHSTFRSTTTTTARIKDF